MSLKQRLEADEVVLTSWSGVPDALTVEIMAAQGFDAVTLDMQHGGHNEDSVLRCLAPVLSAAKAAIVRVPVGRFDMASRALDFGSEAVIAPMINSLADARAFAAATKYPPLGQRSWGPTYAFPRYGHGDHQEWLRTSNGRTLSFAMIETREALDVLDDIVEVPGIDAVFLGPGDLSIAWSEGRQINSTLADMMDAVASVAAKARAAGKHAGIYVTDTAFAGRFVEMGYRLLATGSEQQLIAQGAAGLLSGLKQSIGAR